MRAIGARNGRPRLVSPVDETAQRHGAGVEQETQHGGEAYAGATEVVPIRYVQGDLPG